MFEKFVDYEINRPYKEGLLFIAIYLSLCALGGAMLYYVVK